LGFDESEREACFIPWEQFRLFHRTPHAELPQTAMAASAVLSGAPPTCSLIGRIVEMRMPPRLIEAPQGEDGEISARSRHLEALAPLAVSPMQCWSTECVMYCCVGATFGNNGPWFFLPVMLHDPPSLSPLLLMGFDCRMVLEADRGSPSLEHCRQFGGSARHSFGRVMPVCALHLGIPSASHVGHFELSQEVVDNFLALQEPPFDGVRPNVDDERGTDEKILALGWHATEWHTLSHRMLPLSFFELCRRMSPGRALVLQQCLTDADMDDLLKTLLVNPVKLWLHDIIDYQALMVSCQPGYLRMMRPALASLMERVRYQEDDPEAVWSWVEQLYKHYVAPLSDALSVTLLQLPPDVPAIVVEILVNAFILEPVSGRAGYYNVQSALESQELLLSAVRNLQPGQRDWATCAELTDSTKSLGDLNEGLLWLDTCVLMPVMHAGGFSQAFRRQNPTATTLGMCAPDAAALASIETHHPLFRSACSNGLLLTHHEAGNPALASHLLSYYFEKTPGGRRQVTLANLNLWTRAELGRIMSFISLHCPAVDSAEARADLRLVFLSQSWVSDFGAVFALTEALRKAEMRHKPLLFDSVTRHYGAHPCRVLDPPQRCLLVRTLEDNSRSYELPAPDGGSTQVAVIWFESASARNAWGRKKGIKLVEYSAPHGFSADDRALISPASSERAYYIHPEVFVSPCLLKVLRACSVHPVLITGYAHRVVVELASYE
jgi:hypothetical protein